jgi:hypothetical protein
MQIEEIETKSHELIHAIADAAEYGSNEEHRLAVANFLEHISKWRKQIFPRRLAAK